MGSPGGLASWYSSEANQSQQGINSSLNLALNKRSSLSSRPCQVPIIPSHERLTVKAATPVKNTQHKPPARIIFILKKQIYQGQLIWTNGSERWPKGDGMLHSCLVFQHIIAGTDQAVPPQRPKPTPLHRVSLCAFVGIPQCLNSAAFLSCPARSVFVGRVTAAGSGRHGRESCTPWQRGVWCGLQRGPHAQVSV